MDSPKLPYSLSTSSSTPLASSAVKPHRKKLVSRNCILIIIAMTSILLLLITLLIYATVSKSSRTHRNSPPQSPSPGDPLPPETPSPPPIAQIRLACNATRFPDHCVASLSKPGQVPPDPKPVQIIHSAISVSFENLKSGQSKIKSILDSSAGNQNRTNIANICLEILSYSQHRTESTDIAVTSGDIKDARAWMSAALAYQFDCWSGLKTVNDTKQVVETITFFEDLVNLTGNALSMMLSFDNLGDDVVSWIHPATERDGFWETAGPGLGSEANLVCVGFSGAGDGDDFIFLSHAMQLQSSAGQRKKFQSVILSPPRELSQRVGGSSYALIDYSNSTVTAKPISPTCSSRRYDSDKVLEIDRLNARVFASL